MERNTTEKDAVRILALVQQFNASEDGEDWIEWTLDRFAEFLAVDFTRIDSAIIWLNKREYISRDRGNYFITQKGRDYYDNAKRHPHFLRNVQAWKDEVLTGLKEKISRRSGFMVSYPSGFIQAALPKSAPLIDRGGNPEDMLIAAIDRQLKRQKRREG